MIKTLNFKQLQDKRSTFITFPRARKHLDNADAKAITLILTSDLRASEDFTKALLLVTDHLAISIHALQAIGCLGMRACGINYCPVGIATQKENLRNRIIIDASAKHLTNFFNASSDLLRVIARACGYNHVKKFNFNDLSAVDYQIHQ